MAEPPETPATGFHGGPPSDSSAGQDFKIANHADLLLFEAHESAVGVELSPLTAFSTLAFDSLAPIARQNLWEKASTHPGSLMAFDSLGREGRCWRIPLPSRTPGGRVWMLWVQLDTLATLHHALRNFYSSYVFNRLFSMTDSLTDYIFNFQGQRLKEEDGPIKDFIGKLFQGFKFIEELATSTLHFFPLERGYAVIPPLRPTSAELANLKNFLEGETRKRHLSLRWNFTPCDLPPHQEPRLTQESAALLHQFAAALIEYSGPQGALEVEGAIRPEEVTFYLINQDMVIDAEEITALSTPVLSITGKTPKKLAHLIKILHLIREFGGKFLIHRLHSKGFQFSLHWHFEPSRSGENLKIRVDQFLHQVEELSRDCKTPRSKGRRTKKNPTGSPDLNRAIGRCLLPKRVPRFQGLHLRSRFFPQGACGTDFYGFNKVSETRLLVLFGHIETCTTLSTLLFSLLLFHFREMALGENPTPQGVLEELQEEMSRHLSPLERDNISITIILYDSLTCQTEGAVAGHPLALILRKNQGDTIIPKRGDFLGSQHQPNFSTFHHQLEIGDALFFASPSLLSLKFKKPFIGAGEPQDFPGLLSHLLRKPGGEDPVHRVVEHFTARAATGAAPFGLVPDDVTLLGLTVADPHSFSYIIPSRMENIQEVVSILLRFADSFGIDSQGIYFLRLAIHEALVNAIEHGNKFDPGKSIWVDFNISREKFIIKVRDEGTGYKLETVENPLSPENVWKEGGRGIFLIRQLMDGMFLNDQGNEITMIKNLSGPACVGEPLGQGKKP